jgi:hypothetical protein
LYATVCDFALVVNANSETRTLLYPASTPSGVAWAVKPSNQMVTQGLLRFGVAGLSGEVFAHLSAAATQRSYGSCLHKRVSYPAGTPNTSQRPCAWAIFSAYFASDICLLRRIQPIISAGGAENVYP